MQILLTHVKSNMLLLSIILFPADVPLYFLILINFVAEEIFVQGLYHLSINFLKQFCYL